MTRARTLVNSWLRNPSDMAAGKRGQTTVSPDTRFVCNKTVVCPLFSCLFYLPSSVHQRNRAVIEGFGGDIQISRPADGVERDECLLE